MIKKFEQMDFNEDWEEDEPISTKSKGPFDDILEYGHNGLKFKCGDRVKFTYNDGVDFHLSNKKGTIVNYFGLYLVCFDENIGGTSGIKRNIPKGHGWWCLHGLELIKKNPVFKKIKGATDSGPR